MGIECVDLGYRCIPVFVYDIIYVNSTPVATLSQDTGINAENLPDARQIIAACLFTVDVSQLVYSINVVLDNDLAQIQPGIRQLRTAEPVDGLGDIAFAIWLEPLTGTYHYSLDVDGGGKTLNSVNFLVKQVSFHK